MTPKADRYELAACAGACLILVCALALLAATVAGDVIPMIDKTAPLYHLWRAMGG